jgi:predicted PurR-regulated permease PerM
MVRDFLAAIFLAAVIAFFLSQPQAWLARKLGDRDGLAAALLVVFAILAVVFPASLLVGVIVEQAIEVARFGVPWVQEQIASFRAEGIEGLPEWLPFREQIIAQQETIISWLTRFSGTLGSLALTAVRAGTGGTLVAVLNIFILIYALYYFLVSGPGVGRSIVSLMPLSSESRGQLVDRAISTMRATVKGTFVIALVQGALTGIGLLVAGVPGAIFWAAIAAFLSVIPMIGPPLIWIPAALWLGASGNYWAAGGLTVWGFLVVGSSDNLLRPALVGKDAKMSDLMVLISTLGGLGLFGAVGIIVGPMIAALVSSVWAIFRDSYEGLIEEHPEEEEEPDAEESAEPDGEDEPPAPAAS